MAWPDSQLLHLVQQHSWHSCGHVAVSIKEAPPLMDATRASVSDSRVWSCVSSCRRCVFSMNAFAFFATNFMSKHFLFISWTDLLTGDTALTASVTSLRCTCPRHTAADKENKMIFLIFTQNYFAVCLRKVFLSFPILFVHRLTGCTSPQ